MNKIENLFQRIEQLLPNPQCVVYDNDYDSMVWSDEREKPTVGALEAVDIDLINAKTELEQQLTVFYENNKNFVIEFQYTKDSVLYSTHDSIEFNNIGVLQNMASFVPTFDYLKMWKPDGEARVGFNTANLEDKIQDCFSRNIDQGLAARAHSEAIEALTTISEVENYDITASIAIVPGDTVNVQIFETPYIIDLTDASWETVIKHET